MKKWFVKFVHLPGPDSAPGAFMTMKDLMNRYELKPGEVIYLGLDNNGRSPFISFMYYAEKEIREITE